ncbi:nucleotidyltransferase domain-containing protein [Pontibacter sp. 172403-2]|uniref:nucleotidyltransferase domain-containing protein n=1 Tax=Pontibacter rufus TaxID=2791028 RepID=UPI0018AFD809|nr:nucleotidyltransferase domain-containing protein [Pontibacter sp. 172403-2]MBF9252387.1 nucleotidyltransferase domain-containing protein [Pontibacter sp. 172403-2]
MDKGQAIEITRKYVDSLKNKFDIQRAILFGSYAKGTNHDDSDIDVAIILRHVNDIIDTQIELMKLRRQIDLRIEPHPFDSHDFNRTNPVVNEILKYGIDININAA